MSLELIRRLQRRLDNLVSRAKITLVDDSSLQQRAQLSIGGDDDVLNDCERFQEYGFTAVPQDGAEALVILLGGRRQIPIILKANDRRTRLIGLQPGEVAMYTDQGDYVIIRRGGAIEIKGSGSVTVTSPNVAFSGSVTIDGDVDIKGNCEVEGSSGITVPNGDVAAGASGIQLSTHHHTGVQSGGSLTGPPTA